MVDHIDPSRSMGAHFVVEHACQNQRDSESAQTCGINHVLGGGGFVHRQEKSNAAGAKPPETVRALSRTSWAKSWQLRRTTHYASKFAAMRWLGTVISKSNLSMA